MYSLYSTASEYLILQYIWSIQIRIVKGTKVKGQATTHIYLKKNPFYLKLKFNQITFPFGLKWTEILE